MSKELLLIDDDELVLMAVGDLLESQGYLVSTASDPREGLEMARRQRFDLVTLDLIMPKLSGYEVCERLRQIEGYADVPVVMLTAKSTEADRQRGMAAGATEFFPKPIDPARLLSRIDELVA